MDRAQPCGGWGRRFESCQAHHHKLRADSCRLAPLLPPPRGRTPTAGSPSTRGGTPSRNRDTWRGLHSDTAQMSEPAHVTEPGRSGRTTQVSGQSPPGNEAPRQATLSACSSNGSERLTSDQEAGGSSPPRRAANIRWGVAQNWKSAGLQNRRVRVRSPSPLPSSLLPALPSAPTSGERVGPLGLASCPQSPWMRQAGCRYAEPLVIRMHPTTICRMATSPSQATQDPILLSCFISATRNS